MTDELLSYLLDDLPEDRRQEVERRLEVDPEWRAELARLKECLAQGDESETDSPTPSDDLVDRTCCLVDRVCNRLALGAGLSEANEPAKRSSWSLSNVLVVAGIVLIGASVLLPAIRQGRDASRRISCENNLLTLGTALYEYVKKNPRRQLPVIGAQENAGAYAMKLADAGIISRRQLARTVVCPDTPLADQVRTQRVMIAIPSREQLERANGKVLIRWWRTMGGSYAYRIGYFDEEGVYQPPRYNGDKYAPLLGDAPSLQLPGVRSPNHNGGQNIIRQDLSLKFVTDCAADLTGCRRKTKSGVGDHLYLNNDNRHAAGIGPDDVVLARSEYTPLGRLNPVPKSLAAGCSTSPMLWIYVTGLPGTPSSAQDGTTPVSPSSSVGP